jgi:hypothetical protein
MGVLDHFKFLKTPEIRLAWMVALAADAIQIAALPLFAEGAISPADTVLDLAVGAILVRLLGWHWAFLPTLAAELLPGFDLFPTWTAAVWYVSRQLSAEPMEIPDSGRKVGDVEILPPEGSVRRG